MKIHRTLVSTMMKTPRLAGLLALIKFDTNNENSDGYDYDALTPSLMEEKDAKHYINALNFACHEPDIKNIAVTGPYGAGKSSVLLTWSKHREKDLKIMTVSLADFDMIRATSDPEEKSEEPGTKAEKKARQQEKSIEYSILQQILYKAPKSELPHSRIERIADVTPSQTRKMTLGLLATVGCGMSGLIFLFPDYFREKLSISAAFSEFILNIPSIVRIGLLASSMFFITFYLVLSKLYKMGIFDRRVSIEKIDLSKGATISTRPSDPSLLNVFIDEIVYFFEKQKYNIVIFEDLDRNNDGAIFIKLREINQLINNGRTVLDPVRFIYALREDIFNSPEARTKFFDFVMPVIPVMDSQNATDHFTKKFREDEFSVIGFEQCVARLAVFIPDMRVLNSIANEFRLYRNLVNNGENIIRLLSLIAYKNICSHDYNQIDIKKGILYSVMNAHVAGNLIAIVEERINSALETIEFEISEINDEHKSNKHEVVRDILKIYISDKTKHSLYFSNQNGQQFFLDQVINDENLFLSLLKSTDLSVKVNGYGTTVVRIIPSEANEIQDEYNRRCELLNSKSDGKLSVLETRADELRQQKRRVQVSSPGTLIERIGSKGFMDWVSKNLHIDCSPDNREGYTSSQFDFIYSLLRWDYLSTDYMSYRSVFIPGSLSSNDNDFIRAVSAGRDRSITTAVPLERIANVVAKLRELGLILQDNAWHADVLLYLLEHERAQLHEVIKLQLEDGEDHRLEQLSDYTFSSWSISDSILYTKLMANETITPHGFLSRLDKMRGKISAMRLLVILLCSSDLRRNYFTNDMKFMAELIFSEHGDIADVVPEGYAECFTANLLHNNIFLSRIDDCKSEQGRVIVSIIARMNLWKYTKNNFLNIIRILFGYNDDVMKEFYDKPLSTIRAMGISFLNNPGKMRFFIEDFFIASRDYDLVVEVLNNSEIPSNITYKIIRNMNFLIDDIREVQDRKMSIIGEENESLVKKIYNVLIKNNRVKTSWNNTEFLLNYNGDVDLNLSEWFDKNYENITDIPTALSSFDLFNLLMQKLYNSGALSDAARRKILTSIHVTLLSLPENMTIEKTALLIEYHRLAPIADVYQQLYQAFHTEREKIYPLLVDFVLQRPDLLENAANLILFSDGKFDYMLARMLMTSKAMPVSVLQSTLNWLWSYDQELFDGPLFIASTMLLSLAPRLSDEKTLRAILVQCLKAGNVPHDLLLSVIELLSDQASKAFISDLNYRSLDLTDDELELAQLLESAGFIHSLKPENRDGRFRFVPYNSAALRNE